MVHQFTKRKPKQEELQDLYEIIKIAAKFATKKNQKNELFRFWELDEIRVLELEKKFGLFAPKLEKVGEKVGDLKMVVDKKIQEFEERVGGEPDFSKILDSGKEVNQEAEFWSVSGEEQKDSPTETWQETESDSESQDSSSSDSESDDPDQPKQTPKSQNN